MWLHLHQCKTLLLNLLLFRQGPHCKELILVVVKNQQHNQPTMQDNADLNIKARIYKKLMI